MPDNETIAWLREKLSDMSGYSRVESWEIARWLDEAAAKFPAAPTLDEPAPAEPADANRCECFDWATELVVSGHHHRCERFDFIPFCAAIVALLRGMEQWAADEDGIHPDAWDAYAKGCELTCRRVKYEQDDQPAEPAAPAEAETIDDRKYREIRCLRNELSAALSREESLREELAATRSELADAKAECDRLRRENAELRKAIEASLRIKGLWLPDLPADVRYDGEVEALRMMHERFVSLTTPAPPAEPADPKPPRPPMLLASPRPTVNPPMWFMRNGSRWCGAGHDMSSQYLCNVDREASDPEAVALYDRDTAEKETGE